MAAATSARRAVCRTSAHGTQFKMAAAGRAQRHCTWYCNLETKQHSCAARESSALSPLPYPYKTAPPTACQESMRSTAGACASPFSDQQIKLPYASELNSISFYWCEGHQAGGPLLGTDSKGSVTNVQTHLWHKFQDNKLSTHLRFLRLLFIHNLTN